MACGSLYFTLSFCAAFLLFLPAQPQLPSKVAYEVGTIAYKIRAVTLAESPAAPQTDAQASSHDAQPASADVKGAAAAAAAVAEAATTAVKTEADAHPAGSAAAQAALRPASAWDSDEDVSLLLLGPAVQMADAYPGDVPHLHMPHWQQAVTDVGAAVVQQGASFLLLCFMPSCL